VTEHFLTQAFVNNLLNDYATIRENPPLPPSKVYTVSVEKCLSCTVTVTGSGNRPGQRRIRCAPQQLAKEIYA
jgi:hypothetical protein